jgi:hypothetical protein
MNFMELNTLIIHNLLRWGIIIFGIYAFLRAVIGLSGKREFSAADNKAGMYFTLFCHTQFLVGLILYLFVSRTTKEAFSDMGSAMKDTELRFWVMEHIFGMIVAITLVQIGRIKSKKATTDKAKHKKAAIFFGLGLLIILITMPGMFGLHERPWFRFWM